MKEAPIRDHVAPLERELRRYKALAESAMAQVDESVLNRPTPGFDNSIAVLVWHISGNLKSRFTDFLTTDGEKPWRHRDEEFVSRSVGRPELLEKWEEGWAVLLSTLGALTDDDLSRIVTIRQEKMPAQQALYRVLGHVSYHVGQMVYIAKAARGDAWSFLTIPPGKSEEANRKGEGEWRTEPRSFAPDDTPHPFLYPPIGHQPHQRDQHVQTVGQPHVDEREPDGRHVHHDRELAFEVAPNRLRQPRVRAVRQQRPDEDRVGHGRRDQHHAVTAVGSGAKWFSPIQPVANGTSDSQNSRCRFAQRILPFTRSTT